MARNAINEIIPGKLYQRGQILSWPREDKLAMLKERNISIVVNLWPKIDSDFSGSDLDLYLYLPVPRSKDMTSFTVRAMATAVAAMLLKRKKAALVLCEAGVTRSVFFCVLVVSAMKGISLGKAYSLVEMLLPKHRMKSFMKSYCMKRGG